MEKILSPLATTSADILPAIPDTKSVSFSDSRMLSDSELLLLQSSVHQGLKLILGSDYDKVVAKPKAPYVA